MEKRVLVWLLLTIGILFVWMTFVDPPKKRTKPATPPDAGKPADGKRADGKPADPAEEPSDGPGEKDPEPEADAEPAVVEAPDEGPWQDPKPRKIDTGTVEWELTSWGGAVGQARLKRYALETNQDLSDPAHWYPLFSGDFGGPANRRYTPRPLAVDILTKGGTYIRTSAMDWTLVEDRTADDRVVYRLDLTGQEGVVLEKEFRFPERVDGIEAYHVDMTLRLTVSDAKRAKSRGADAWTFRLVGPAGVTGEPESSLGMILETEVLTTDRVDPQEFDGALDVQGPFKSEAWPGPSDVWPDTGEQGQNSLIKGFGIHTRYFGAFLKPSDPTSLGARKVEIVAVKDLPLKTIVKGKAVQKEFGNHLTAVDFQLPLPQEGQTVERSFLLYAGPMDPGILTQEPYDTFAPIISYGWALFDAIAKILLLLLGVIQSVVGNWGVAIIILTLIVRMAMFPLSRKSQVSMQKFQRQMARVKPKMDAIKEKHKANKQKQQQELAKLMREEGMRPVPAGCLMMFIQLPIFIGLFQALRWSIDLRHAPFLWASDLTAPDRMFDLPDVDMFLVPDFFNLFPILMAITWFLSMAMAPKPVDPQQQQTMKMMKWMPILFSVMLYNYAAGLSLYMVVSSTWSIFKAKVVKKLIFKDEPEIATGTPAPSFRKGK